MPSENFVRSVISNLRNFVETETEYRRLDLTPAIVSAWREKLAGDTFRVISEIRSIATSNRVDLDLFEGAHTPEGFPQPNRAVLGAEAIIAAVDDFLREASGYPPANRKRTA